MDVWASGLDERRVSQAYRGRCSWIEVQPGLILHTTDATSLEQYDISGSYAPGVALHCFLEGSADADLAGRPMNLGRERGAPVRMRMASVAHPEPFRRRSKPGHYARKLNLLLSFDWLAENGLELHGRRDGHHLKFHEWAVSPDDIIMMERLVQLAGRPSPLTRLEVQSATLGLVCSAFANFDIGDDAASLSNPDARKLDRMEQFIREDQGAFPTLAEIAQAGGVSLSTMRRLFRAAHDCTVQEFVRNLRLTRARRALERDGVSVAQAARIAGYRSPENFAAAFRKANQMCPSDAQARYLAPDTSSFEG
jgi:AraC-like DNA-binding protein